MIDRRAILCAFLASLTCLMTGRSDDALNGETKLPSARWRRPVAVIVLDDGRHAVVANQRSGSLSLLDLEALRVVGETQVGESLSDMVALPGRTVSADKSAPPENARWLACDDAAHELLLIERQGDGFAATKRLKVSPFPVTVTVDSKGSRAFVASLWSRTISVVDLARWQDEASVNDSPIVRTVRLPFAPRAMSYVDDSTRLIVADAFGSKLAVIDPQAVRVESVRELPAHGIRQLRLHPTQPRLLLTHQMLNRLSQTTFDDVHWGALMVNCFRSLLLADVLDPKRDLLQHGELDFLGQPDHGAGDPNGFVIRPNGAIAVTLSGTNELILDDGSHQWTTRVTLEENPTAIALTANGTRALVVNTLSDSVSVVGLSQSKVIGTIPLGEKPELSAVDRGERLFRSARLSHDKWFSCQSCHVDGHTNGLLNDNLTDGSFGSPKRVLTLRGIADTPPYAWTGRFNTLAEQVRHSVRSTMQGEPLADEEVNDLVAYLRTLPPPPGIGASDKAAAQRGAVLFERLECARCHARPTFTSDRIADVKLKDERGLTKFNPPSLRGVSQTGPYFHDGRAASIDEVLAKYKHQLDRELTSDELHDLVEFLNGL